MCQFKFKENNVNYKIQLEYNPIKNVESDSFGLRYEVIIIDVAQRNCNYQLDSPYQYTSK
ncbi:hypothetical protein J6TS2_25490 [Heyndrickxia sporothermodurans]|nr:hypothetical protein J6TS2_25490 [Heyndrickxia sporothermodurans]